MWNTRTTSPKKALDHLSEIGNQIGRYVEAEIDKDWQAVSTLSLLVSSRNFTSDEELLSVLRKSKDMSGGTDLFVVTSDGSCFDLNGKKVNNDFASELGYQVRKNTRLMLVNDSSITFVAPVLEVMTFQGKPIVAVSFSKDLYSLVDKLEIDLFGASGVVYLTQSNGLVISQTHKENLSPVFNIAAVIDSNQTKNLKGVASSVNEVLMKGESGVFLSEGKDHGWSYVVVTPVEMSQSVWAVILMVDKAEVNGLMDGFSSSMVTLGGVFLAVIMLFTVLIFVLAFRGRVGFLSQEVRSRERMLYLLVGSTKNVFGLHRKGKRDPDYRTSSPAMTETEHVLSMGDDGHFVLREGDVVPLESVKNTNAQLLAWDGKGEFISDFIPYANDGQTKYLTLRIYPVEDALADYITVLEDSTREREKEDMLRSALAIADSANQAKTKFLSSMSHDIRTPMNVIINMTKFALEQYDNKEVAIGYLKTVLDSSGHLLSLINDVLDVSRIESGRMVFASEPFDLSANLNTIIEMMRPLCEKKHQKLVTELHDIEPVRLLGDELKVRQVMINLLNNACKFTSDGGTITFKVQGHGRIHDDSLSYAFIVSDNGMGIPKEDQEKIFLPFERGSSKGLEKTEGTGLGLSICKSYIDAMGGTMSLQSEVGKGSTFAVELCFPIDAASAMENTRKAVPSEGISCNCQGLRTLLCEDNPINQKIAKMLLEKLGFTVDIASDGGEAYQKFTASSADTYAIVYTDIMMPVMNGYEVAVAIRGSDHPQAKTVPIVAMSANVFAEDIAKARAAGMNGHIDKPLDFLALRKVTLDILGQTEDKR